MPGTCRSEGDSLDLQMPDGGDVFYTHTPTQTGSDWTNLGRKRRKRTGDEAIKCLNQNFIKSDQEKELIKVGKID